MAEIVSIRLDEERRDENRRKTLSGVFTFVITALLVLVLVFFGMPYMDPPPPEEGAMVALGDPDAGMNSDEQLTEQEQQAATSSEESSSQTQDIEDAPTEAPSDNPTKPNPTPDKKKDDKPEVNEDLIYKKGGEKSDDEDGKKDGPKGAEDGKGVDPLGKGSGNTGNGTWDLAGRDIVSAPKVSCTFNQEGVLVLKITVNSSGKVISASPDYKDKRNNITDMSNINCAKNAVLSTYLFSSKEGAGNATGTVVFNFKKK